MALSASQRMRANTERLKKGLPPGSPGASATTRVAVIEAEIVTMEHDLARREQSYQRRETGYVARIRDLASSIDDERERDKKIS